MLVFSDDLLYSGSFPRFPRELLNNLVAERRRAHTYVLCRTGMMQVGAKVVSTSRGTHQTVHSKTSPYWCVFVLFMATVWCNVRSRTSPQHIICRIYPKSKIRLSVVIISKSSESNNLSTCVRTVLTITRSLPQSWKSWPYSESTKTPTICSSSRNAKSSLRI